MSNYPTKTVFAFNAEGGLIHPFGNQPIPVLERFFLGGENSIRGHRYRSIFLRDKNGDPVRDANEVILGGDKYAQFNLEYHFVLGGPFRVLLFADAGNVFGDGQSFDLSRPAQDRGRRAAGASCRCSARRCGSSTPRTSIPNPRTASRASSSVSDQLLDSFTTKEKRPCRFPIRFCPESPPPASSGSRSAGRSGSRAGGRSRPGRPAPSGSR